MKFLERIANKPSSITIDYIPRQCAFCQSPKILRSAPSHLDERLQVKLRFFCRSCMIDMFVVDTNIERAKQQTPAAPGTAAENTILRNRLKNTTEKLEKTRRALRIQNARQQKDSARIEVLEQLVAAQATDRSQLLALQAKLLEAAQEIKDKEYALAKANAVTDSMQARRSASNLVKLPTLNPNRVSHLRSVDTNMEMAKRIEQGLSLSKLGHLEPSRTRTAQQNYARAVRYMKGNGVPVNPHQAVRYFELAARAGHIKAQFNMGLCRARGTGGKKNLQDSYRWFAAAAEQGHQRAFTLLSGIAAMISAEKNTELGER